MFAGVVESSVMSVLTVVGVLMVVGVGRSLWGEGVSGDDGFSEVVVSGEAVVCGLDSGSLGSGEVGDVCISSEVGGSFV